ncbi:hypothetical protein WA026_002619 [Henosepilachna vigintioctopunctata]|uniref:Protein DP71L n=1 Tax=Henosepilachna vigintioctopunctata TaxID=420089 RepID=A0AAW1U185_9CUCU
MNIISNLKTNFIAPTTCTSQIRQFHVTSSPFKNKFEGNTMSKNISPKNFTKPNILNQNTHDEKYPSNYNKINHSKVRLNGELENSSNMITEVFENTNFGGEISLELPKQTTDCGASSRKRARKSPHPKKFSDKHNSNRQLLKEMMDVDFSNDSSTDLSLIIETEDKNFENNVGYLNLSDVIVLRDHSSPVRIDIGIDSTISPQRTCFTFPVGSPKCRSRQISITESEDSFIVFESGADEECELYEDVITEDESSESEEDEESDTDSPGSIVATKKVRFANDKKLCEIHPMIKWSFAYQAARKGPWEMYARDRERFKNRISLIEGKISHCFEPEHRQKVFNRLFEENVVE